MPLYEYECKKCGAREEQLQDHGEILQPRCSKCGSKMVRLISAPAIQFKGSGWYVTDYGRRGATPESKGGASGGSDASAEKPAEKTPEKAGDSKPARGGTAAKSNK
jgi:putative FmdB family regulatory protein